MRISRICKLVLAMCSSSFPSVKMEEMETFKKKYFNKIMSHTTLASNGQCQLWGRAKKKSKGGHYGIISCYWRGKSRTFSVHRLVLVFSRGWHLDDISDDGIEVSHLCHNSLCVNPQHLSYEPHQVNTIRRACVNAGRCTGHFGVYPACLLHLKI